MLKRLGKESSRHVRSSDFDAVDLSPGSSKRLWEPLTGCFLTLKRVGLNYFGVKCFAIPQLPSALVQFFGRGSPVKATNQKRKPILFVPCASESRCRSSALLYQLFWGRVPLLK